MSVIFRDAKTPGDFISATVMEECLDNLIDIEIHGDESAGVYLTSSDALLFAAHLIRLVAENE